KIQYQRRGALVGPPAQHATLPRDRVGERAHRVRREVGERRIEIDEPDVLRLDEREAERALVGGLRGRHVRDEKNKGKGAAKAPFPGGVRYLLSCAAKACTALAKALG